MKNARLERLNEQMKTEFMKFGDTTIHRGQVKMDGRFSAPRPENRRGLKRRAQTSTSAFATRGGPSGGGSDTAETRP
jgi:hypothetical protein